MAPDDFWSRKRREEEKEEEEREAEKERAEREAKFRKKAGIAASSESLGNAAAGAGGSLDKMLKDSEVLIEQLNHLYNQFVAGVNSLPPRELRGRLEHIMILLSNEQKATPASRFRFQSIHSSYTSHCSRWDKMMRDLETGKIKRVAGPKRGH